jgi:hypothetical protein
MQVNISEMSNPEDDDIDLNAGQLPPDAPTKAEIAEFDGNSATIKWIAPVDDGGAPVKEYIIEYRKHKTEEWLAKPEIKPSKFLSEKVEELTTNTKYEFRVCILFRTLDLYNDKIFYHMSIIFSASFYLCYVGSSR